jgi:type II secretory pathway pseudopilin PulG
MKINFSKNLDGASLKVEAGFTLMELVVSATIFALVSVGLLSLFNYTLQINRRSEALRQVTQGMRSFVETLVKEVRSGQIDYLVVNGSGPSPVSPIGPCAAPTFGPALPPFTSVGNTYNNQENRLAVIDSEGKEECIYLAYGPGGAHPAGDYVGSGVFKADVNSLSSTYNPTPVLVVKRSNLPQEILNPANFSVENLMFVIRPLCDPYAIICNGGYQTIQPFVFMNLKFVTRLPTGENVSIFYQTTISTNKYDVPH